jgi:hypothetical protein
MTSSPAQRVSVVRALSLCLLGVYLALGVLALACPLDLTLSPGGHQHHSQAHHDKAGHASLCAWACQVGSSLHLSPAGTDGRPLFLCLGMAGAVYPLLPIDRPDQARSRSPPLRFSF